MDRPSTTPDSFLRYLKDTILARTSLAEIGRRLSKTGDPSWLSRALRNQRRLSISRLFQILREIGVGEAEFFQGYAEQSNPLDAEIRPARPQDLLRRARGGQGTTTDLLDRVKGLSVQPIRQDAPPYGVPERSREIDSLRESNRETAGFHAEIWILEILSEVKPGHSLAGAKVAELASALGAWGSVERLLGRAINSARALEMAFELHGIHQWSPAYADLLERAAVTLREMGYVEEGLALARDASALFRIAGDEWSETKALMILGILASQSGRSDLARSSLARCLDYSDLDDRRRAAVLATLAATEINDGRLGGAREYLDEALRIEGLPPRITLQIRWQSTRLDLEEDRFEAGAEQLEALLEEGEEHLEPIDLFLLFFDLAEVLAHMGAQGRFNRYAAKMARLLPLLENHPMALSLAGRFLETAMVNPLRNLAVRSARADFAEAAKGNQPPGSG